MSIQTYWKSTSAVVGVIILSAFFLQGSGLISEERPKPVPASVNLRQSKMLQVGEELEYKVSYSFFNIGTIRTKVIGMEERDEGRTTS